MIIQDTCRALCNFAVHHGLKAIPDLALSGTLVIGGVAMAVRNRTKVGIACGVTMVAIGVLNFMHGLNQVPYYASPPKKIGKHTPYHYPACDTFLP